MGGNSMSFGAFLITSFIIILMPGTGVVYTISTGIMNGRHKSIVAAFGCTLGIVPHLCVSIALTSMLMQMNNTVFTIMRYAGATYLIYMGVGMILSKDSIQFEEETGTEGALSIIRRGILINLLNPKLTLFFFSFLPQYVRGTEGRFVIQSAVLGIAFMIMTFVVFAIYGLLAGTARGWLSKSEKRISALQKLFGTVFVGFALKLALEN